MKKINALVKEFEHYMVDKAGISCTRIVYVAHYARNNIWLDKKLGIEYTEWLLKREKAM